jgi:Flp pilus assembly protein TadB
MAHCLLLLHVLDLERENVPEMRPSMEPKSAATAAVSALREVAQSNAKAQGDTMEFILAIAAGVALAPVIGALLYATGWVVVIAGLYVFMWILEFKRSLS